MFQLCTQISLNHRISFILTKAFLHYTPASVICDNGPRTDSESSPDANNNVKRISIMMVFGYPCFNLFN